MGPVMIMAGGTGGHVFPALATARCLRDMGVEVFWIGTRKGMESHLVPRHGIEIEWIPVEGLRGGGWRRLLKAPVKLTLALLRALRVIRRRRPVAALSMGGFVAGPGGVAARLMGVPLLVHEQNKLPGLTNQWLSRLAVRVFEAFPGSFPAARGAIACGNPVRREIVQLADPDERFARRDGVLRLLVLGGSLGARALNQTLPAALALLPQRLRPEIRHQAGERTLSEARAAYEEHGVQARVTPFIQDMAAAYGWADLVIGRAGALTLSELAAAGVGSILVPYPHAVDDHQTRNAEYLVDAGAALLIPQGELTARRLADALTPYLEDRDALAGMARRARALALTEADQLLARACLEVANQ